MNVSTVEAQLRQLVADLLTHGLVLASKPVIRSPAGSGHRVSWSKVAGISVGFGNFATIDEYAQFLDNGDYNVVLSDGSLLQASYSFEGDKLVGHRLCHYPCPIDISELAADGGSITEWMELLSTDELRQRIRLRTPLRLDYDPRAATKDHPASHLTISFETCRIPVFAPVSVGHFVRLVFFNFYPELWKKHAFLRELANHQWNTELPDDLEANHAFMSWRRAAGSGEKAAG